MTDPMPTGAELVAAFIDKIDAFMPPAGGDVIMTLFLAKRAPGVDGDFTNGEAMRNAYLALMAEGVEGFGAENVAAFQVSVATEPQTEISDVITLPVAEAPPAN